MRIFCSLGALCAAFLFFLTTLKGEIRKDLQYGEAGGEKLLLDAGIPDEGDSHPIVLMVHGGGWVAGDKSTEMTQWMEPLRQAGFTWVSINYRLAPTHRWPACIDDVNTAIRWVKAHAKELKGDAQKIALMGHSAGGHLATYAAVTAEEDTRVQAVLGLAAVTDFEQELQRREGLSKSLQALFAHGQEPDLEVLERLRESSTRNRVGGNPPPFLLMHGDADKTVPLVQSFNLQSRLRGVEGRCVVMVLPGAPHRLRDWDKADPQHKAKAIAWLKQTLGIGEEAGTVAAPGVPQPCGGALELPVQGPGAGFMGLWYRQPAEAWVEALPVGNGRLGAMVFGGKAIERLQLNEDSLWTGKPHEYQHEGAVESLAQLRNLLREGKQKEAEALASKTFMSEPLRQEMYQPLADLIIELPGHEAAKEYRRELDLARALARVSYTIGETRFLRETFSSYPDQVLVERLEASGPLGLSGAVRLGCAHGSTSVQVFEGKQIGIVWRVSDKGLRFAVKARILAEGGTLRAGEDGVRFEGARAVTVLVAGATSHVNYLDISADPEARVDSVLAAAEQKGYEALSAAHERDYVPLFKRLTLELGRSEAASLPTDERLQREDKTDDPALITLTFQYGRYLLLSSSRKGAQAANLQGIWNDRVWPPWGSKYTTNINLEMNYWPAEVANLSECTEPLFSLLKEVAESGRKTARAHYGARGWVLHHNTDLWRGTAPINASDHGIWPTGGAWLCKHLWEHYSFNPDRGFLEREAYPYMRDSAQFFLDYLTEDPATGLLVSGPSNSPEHGGLVMAPAMDHQIIRELFADTAEAARILGVDTAFRDEILKARSRIAPDQIGRLGQLQEWAEDVDSETDTHRHVSHLWALFPGSQITPDTPALFAAAKKSLEFRGDDGTGWSLGWKTNFWARLLDGDHALRILDRQLRYVAPATAGVKTKGGGTYPNLFDAHPPFQIDGNFAATAGVCELLVQSHRGFIELLPALPTLWKTGSIDGVRARGGYTVDIEWAEGTLVKARVTPDSGSLATTVCYAGKTLQPVKLGDGAFEYRPYLYVE